MKTNIEQAIELFEKNRILEKRSYASKDKLTFLPISIIFLIELYG